MSLKLRQLFRQYHHHNVFNQSALRVSPRSGFRPLHQSLISVPQHCLPGGPIVLQQRYHFRRNGTLSRNSAEGLDLGSGLETINSPLSSCPGCGALAQTVEPGAAGFYNIKRSVVGSFLQNEPTKGWSTNSETEDQVFSDALANAPEELRESLQSRNAASSETETTSAEDLPLCDRCHDLIHHRIGVPIHHPSLDSLQDTISESPHKYNHIYHVLDAADFPMSLIPRIQRILHLSPQRAKNRRSKHAKYSRGRLAELSFIITRSDLLAPKKEQVDRLMPYLTQVLRDALGASGKDVRLGNVRCVSSKRGWWTKELKSEIWRRGGGGWMVGKVNVGKSNLFEVAFPKGRNQEINITSIRNRARLSAINGIEDRYEDEISFRQHGESQEELEDDERLADQLDDITTSSDLLPPARMETAYPVMPTVSSLPGTTASPIRIPFGSGRGELVDLPGLSRGDLASFVKPGDRDSLVMKQRINPEQYVLKPGQSLLLGGLVRIDPCLPLNASHKHDLVILAYPFVPLHPHLTSTLKANEIQSGQRTSGIPTVVDDAGRAAMSSAGRFQLKWDVTKQRAGPLTTASGAGLKAKVLPFQVFSTDVLIEGVGWVELVTQVRRRKSSVTGHAREEGSGRHAAGVGVVQDRDATKDSFAEWERQVAGDDVKSTSQEGEAEEAYPTVEVFSPNGTGIASRRPMGAWLLGGEKAGGTQKSRPRRSMANARR